MLSTYRDEILQDFSGAADLISSDDATMQRLFVIL
jgi:hypothetical protein